MTLLELKCLVSRASEYAIEKHNKHNHIRDGGEPYWRHPERVVKTLADRNASQEVQAAAWMHDIPEDCAENTVECEHLLQEIEQIFGHEVAGLVREVTNFFDKSLHAKMSEKQQRLIAHAPNMSVGAKQIKLADRYDNIIDMPNWNMDKRKLYASFSVRLVEALTPVPPGFEKIAADIVRTSESILEHIYWTAKS